MLDTAQIDTRDLALGGVIRRRRNAARLSLEELGRACGITYQQIQKYETGSNRVSYSRLVEIAAGLQCTVVDLVTDADTVANVSPDALPDAHILQLSARLMALPIHRRRHVVASLHKIADAIDASALEVSFSEAAE